ncbi:conserved hypothetical protein (plasmid) [Borreliella afzelii PKo]|uniref:Uncharacterized protein n=1 Tax=Borreliella afzelii (strain PKo) TaxID=390236 RepID=G0IT38_BORAP|nr:conserved hypothetical protein [Borreliella afzelii PKo]
MKRIYIILYFIFALFSLNANEFLRGVLNSRDLDDVDFEDFKLQENSAYFELINKKYGNEKGYILISADKDVFNLMYIFGTALGKFFSDRDKTKTKDETKAKEEKMFGDINGLVFGYTPKKGTMIALLFKKEEILKNTNNIKNIIISYSFDKEEPIINSLSNQWIVEDDGLFLKENELSNFLKKLLSSRVLKVKVYDNQKINETFSIRLRNFQDLYDKYEDDLN